MRVSIDRDDPGYEAYSNIVTRGNIIRVFLDGVEQHHVLTADEEAGSVLRHVLDASGNAQADPSNPEDVWIETVTGNVQVTHELPADTAKGNQHG